MADLKISELTELTAPANADYTVIVDESGTDTTKYILMSNLMKGITTATSMGIQGAEASAGILNLTTAGTTTVDGDKLGQINFQAPLDAAGDDAILVSGAIWAEADATFSSSVNTTSIVIATGTTAAAAEIVRINNTGMTLTAGLTTAGAILNLSTNEPSVADGDVLGRIDFQAPLDTGVDSDIVAASVYAESDATFSDTVNTTSIVLATGTTSTPIERVRIGNTVGITVAANTTGLSIGACSTTAINITAKCQDTEAGLDEAAVLRHGSYTTEIAYGTITADNLVLKSTHISAATTAKYIFGDVNFIETSAASTGYIHVGYNYLSVGHNLANGYATRSRIAMTASSTAGEQVACLATMEVDASVALTGSQLTAGLFELNIAATATVDNAAHCIEVRPLVAANVDGVTSGIRVNVNCSSDNYVDYGIDIVSMSEHQTAAIRILATPESNALACGIHIEGQTAGSTSSVTNAISFIGTVTNALDFEAADGTNGAETASATIAGATASDGAIRIDVAGTPYYVPCFTATNTTNSW